MNKYDITKRIEDFAPLETQEKWDASGWIVDLETSNVEKVMFALTITKNVVKQALEENCDMIISHHPLFFVPLEYKKINMYCAHTNLDKANGGTTDLILKELGFVGEPYGEFARIVSLPNPISINDLKQKLQKLSPNLRLVNNNNIQSVKTIGFCAGSGSEFIESTPSEAFITGDLKFHTASESEKVIFDIGHFESEIISTKLLKELTKVEEKGVFANEKSPFI